MSAVCNHPINDNIKLIGSKNEVLVWDTRTTCQETIKVFKSYMNQVQDLIFINDSEFVSAGDVVSKDSAEYSLMAWDFETTACISNQIFHEKYICTSLRKHPFSSVFYAQTHGNYICEFSTRKPYKMNKFKRYETKGHLTQGYSIGFDLSSSGSFLATGSANGNAFVYNLSSSKMEFKLEAFENKATLNPCMDAKFQPNANHHHQLLALSSWNGDIKIYKI